jgi:hypothetical protein
MSVAEGLAGDLATRDRVGAFETAAWRQRLFADTDGEFRYLAS